MNEFENDNHIVDEDVILPDDFEETPIEQVEEPVTEEVDTTETEEQPTQEEVIEQSNDFLKIKYNKEEISLDQERARELAQKGMNFDKAVERAKQEARDAWVAEQKYEWNGKPITTETEYKQAVREQELMQHYQSKDLPDDVIQELIENRRFREEYQEKDQKQQEEQQEKAQQESELSEFLSYYKQANGRDFDPQKDTIPQEVWKATQNGTPLNFAYMQHHNSELQNQLKVLKQNETNKKKAPVGSITAHGSQEVASEDDFLKGFNSI